MFLININWFSDHISYMETFHFSISIPMEFNISDMFEVESKESFKAMGKKEKLVAGRTEFDKVDETYILMGLVCFVGAHYFSFIKAMQGNKVIWKLYDDDKPIFVYQSWESVLYNILQYGNLPTLMIYEKKTDKNKLMTEKGLSQLQLRSIR